MKIGYLKDRNEPISTIMEIVKALVLEDKKAKLRFVLEMSDVIDLFKKNSFLFERYSFNTQFESTFEFPDLIDFLKKFFMLVRPSKVIRRINFIITIDDVKIKVTDQKETIEIEAPNFRIKLLEPVARENRTKVE
jgi:hypothetical protein